MANAMIVDLAPYAGNTGEEKSWYENGRCKTRDVAAD